MNNEDGNALVISMIIILALVILFAGISALLTSETDFLTREEGETKAQYIAEAALEYSVNIINDNSKWNSTNSPSILKGTEIDRLSSALSGGELSSLTKSISGNEITLESTASSRGIDKTITNVFTPYSGSFDYSMVANGDITMVNNATITGNDDGGDIYSNGSVSYVNNFILIDSIIHSYQSLDIVPTIDLSAIKSLANVYTETEAANLDLSTIGNQISYVEGDLSINNNYEINGNGILVVEGKLTINNSLEINVDTDDYFIIIVKGEGYDDDEDVLYVESGNTTNIKGLIYTYGNIYFKNSPVLTGSLISKGDVEFKNNLEFYFDCGYLETFKYWNIDVPLGASGTNYVLDLIGWSEN